MKIYRSKVTYGIGGTGIITCRPGELLYESPGVIEGTTHYQPEGGSYPISKEIVEDHPEEFEFLREDDKTVDYYLKKIYTQEQWDKQFTKT